MKVKTCDQSLFRGLSSVGTSKTNSAEPQPEILIREGNLVEKKASEIEAEPAKQIQFLNTKQFIFQGEQDLDPQIYNPLISVQMSKIRNGEAVALAESEFTSEGGTPKNFVKQFEVVCYDAGNNEAQACKASEQTITH